MSHAAAGAVTKARPAPAALVLAVLASLAAIPQAFLLGDAVAVLAVGPDAGLTGLSGWPLWAALFAAGALRTALDALAHYAAGLSAIRAKSVLRRTWLGVFAGWSPAAIDRAATGDVVSTVVDRTDGLDPWFIRYPLARLRMTVVPPAILAAILPISWLVALILFLAAPLIPVFMSLIGARAQEIGRRQLDEAGNLTALLLDRVGGLATIRALKADGRVAAEIEARGETLREETMAVLKVAFLSSAALEFFASVGVAVAAVFIGLNLLGLIGYGGDFGLAGGVAMLALAPEFFQPLRDFAAAYHDRANARALDERAAEAFGAPVPRMAIRPVPPDKAAPSAPPPAIRVEGLTVRMPGRTAPILAAFDLDVPAGAMVAVTGPSGSGKSTLLSAIAGLIEGVEGEVRIGGAGAGAAIAWLSQEPLVRHGSVLANLSPAEGFVDRDAAWAVLAAVGLETVVRRMPRGLLTPLGETGAGLSRGELRRLTVARAMLDPAPVLLADEPTADLDADTAAILRAALVAMAGRRTLLVATHDEALAKAAAAVVRIERRPA